MQKTRQLNFNECFDISYQDFAYWPEQGHLLFQKKSEVDYYWLEFELNLIIREGTGFFKAIYSNCGLTYELHIQILQALFVKEKDLIMLDLELVDARCLTKNAN